MLPVGPLMIEHRLIERMIGLMEKELQKIKDNNAVNTGFIDVAVDFLRSYADRCHHGKEEDILFKDLSKKQISSEHKRIMEELIKEHALGRNNVKKLAEANGKYAKGDKSAIPDIVCNMEFLVGFYPKHIEKEDKHFFIPCMDYFSQVEKDNMLNEEWAFDRKLIHEKYAKIVEALE
jgi:hemerythrin-like domain-containing protein